jgi:hypothetical protein
MDLHRAFRRGAEALARGNLQYGDVHKSHGISQVDWELLTQDDHWTPEEARQVRSIIAATIEVSMTIAGLPAVPLPGQYAAAVVAICVAPCNRLMAAMKVPDTFDAAAASGLMEDQQVIPMRPEQMMALVMAYSGGYGGEPAMQRLGEEVKEVVKKDNAK